MVGVKGWWGYRGWWGSRGGRGSRGGGGQEVVGVRGGGIGVLGV